MRFLALALIVVCPSLQVSAQETTEGFATDRYQISSNPLDPFDGYFIEPTELNGKVFNFRECGSQNKLRSVKAEDVSWDRFGRCADGNSGPLRVSLASLLAAATYSRVYSFSGDDIGAIDSVVFSPEGEIVGFRTTPDSNTSESENVTAFWAQDTQVTRAADGTYGFVTFSAPVTFDSLPENSQALDLDLVRNSDTFEFIGNPASVGLPDNFVFQQNVFING